MEFTRNEFLDMIEALQMVIIDGIHGENLEEIIKKVDEKKDLLIKLSKLWSKVYDDHDKIILIGIKD